MQPRIRNALAVLVLSLLIVAALLGATSSAANKSISAPVKRAPVKRFKELIPKPHGFAYLRKTARLVTHPKHRQIHTTYRRYHITYHYHHQTQTLIPGFVTWINSRSALAVRDCESSGNPEASSPSGTYMGAWQMDENFWRSYGGLKFASTPLGATRNQQDSVAYRGYLARGWDPWTCARIVGLIGG